MQVTLPCYVSFARVRYFPRFYMLTPFHTTGDMDDGVPVDQAIEDYFIDRLSSNDDWREMIEMMEI